MTNMKSTKRALLTSVMAMLLCFTMLLGTTFAWFTDSAASASNVITAGNLDIVVEYTLDGTTWKGLDGANDLFQKGLWEPGHTEVVALRIKNNGTLALKYTANMNIVEEYYGKNRDDKDIVLSDILTVSTLTLADAGVDPVLGIDIAKTAIKKAFENENGIAYNGAVPFNKGNVLEKDERLEPGDVHYVVIKVDMAETVGNEANYKTSDDDSNPKKYAPYINFGIDVLATQLAYENDSYGSGYDEEAPYGTYIELNAGDDLLAAMASAEKDMPLTIKLNGNVEWPTDGHHGENDITLASSIVIEGNGYTITATGSGVTPLGDQTAPMTLKNVKIVDNSVSYDESAWELSYLEMGGRVLNCVNVDFVDPITVDSDKATFNGCTFVGHNDKNSTTTTQYGVWVTNGNATFTDCTFTGTRGLKICDKYAPEVGTVVVDGCTFNGISEKPGIAIDDEDTLDMNIIIKNSTFINCKAGDQGLYIYETDDTVPTLENNTVLNNATIVSTKDELLALSAKALTGNNGTAEEAIIVIDADIDMKGAEFSAIIAQRGDKLTILGNGHKISNVKIVSGANDNTTGQASMFYAYPNSTLTVSDLILEDITVTAEANGSGYAAAVIGYCEGAAILNNVDVVNATVTGVKSSGMLVGHLSGSLTANGCDVSGTVTLADFAEEANGHYAGKYIGTLAGATVLSDCTANVTVGGNLNAANIGEIYGRKTAAGSSNVEAVADQAGLNAAISGGSDTVILGNGTYKLPVVTNKEITISGTKDTVIDLSNGTGQMHNMSFVFDGVTIKGASENYKGIIHSKSVVYKNCTLTGLEFLYAETVTFENCDFDSNGQEHNIWTYGSKSVSFVDCDFTYGDRAVNVYTENSSLGTANVSFDGCTFTTTNTASKGAVEINSSSFKQKINVTMVGCTAPAYGDMVGISGWDSANGANATVTVDGAAFNPNQWTK